MNFNFNGELLGLLLLVASAAALGLSIVFDVARVSAERTRATVLQRQTDKRKAALREWTSKTNARGSELMAIQARLTDFVNRRQKVQAELKALEYTKIEMVHELGECDGSALGFWSLLAVNPDSTGVDRRDIIFSRQIWDYRNAAHIWAGSADHAASLLRTAFTPRSGIAGTNLIPLSSAPDGPDGAAA
ncbi:hypothetical protein [Azospirillum sp. sgz301742]